MKKLAFYCSCFVLLCILGVQLSSCTKRDITNPPGVLFNDVDGYVHGDTLLPANSVAYIWVYANKIGVNDYLNGGTIQQSINGSADSIITSMKFVETQFSGVYSYQLGAAGNKYKYVFTFSNQNNVSTADSLTITTY